MHAVELRRLVMLVDVADRNEVDARRPPVDAKFASKRSVSVARSWARVSCVLPKKAAIELSTSVASPDLGSQDVNRPVDRGSDEEWPEILLKTDTKTIMLELGTRKNSQQHQWDVANEVIKPGEKIEISAVHGRWLIVKMPARR